MHVYMYMIKFIFNDILQFKHVLYNIFGRETCAEDTLLDTDVTELDVTNIEDLTRSSMVTPPPKEIASPILMPPPRVVPKF